MFSRIRPKLNHTTVVAYLALFVALSGTAYAVNEFNGSNIQDETLTGADVKGVNGTQTVKGVNGSLTGADISGQPAIAAVGQQAVNGSLNTYDLADGGVRGIDLQADTLTGTQINESALGKVPSATAADTAGDSAKLGGVDASKYSTRLSARVVTYFDGTVYSNTGNGIATWTGTVGHYTVKFPQAVTNCATVVTPNMGVNAGFFNTSQTANVAYSPDGAPDTVAISFLNTQSAAPERPYGFNVVVVC